jgi:molecular chaperone HscB
MASCPRCGAELETPLVCAACGVLLEPPEGGRFEDLGPFALLGLPASYEVDAAELRRRLLRLSRQLHPDFFAARGGEARARAEESTAALNWAHEILSSDLRRADRLIGELGGPSESDEREMPQAFLMEVLEWNEALEEARESAPGSDARAGLGDLADSLAEQRAAAFAEVARLLATAPEVSGDDLRAARQQLNAVRYIDRALREIEALRLEEASTR